MTSLLRYFLAACFPKEEKHGCGFKQRENYINIEYLHFIIPQRQYERFMEIKPTSDELNISQFMFLYRFLQDKDTSQPPGPDYECAHYVIEDRDQMFLLKGWIPTKCERIEDNINNIREIAYSWKPGLNVAVVSHAGMLPSQKKYHHTDYTKSWSRHLTQSDESNQLENSSRLSSQMSALRLPPLNKCSSLVACSDKTQNDDQDWDLVEPVDKRRRHVMNRVPQSTMYRATSDMRVRKERPKAARGPRTKPNSLFQY